jgi:hypothetical protein
MSRDDPWMHLGAVTSPGLRDATTQLHWAAQVLAAAGQTFAEPKGDDSHRAMQWNQDRRELVSAAFREGYPFRVALRIEDLTLQLLDRTFEPLGSLPLAGETMADAHEWLRSGLANYMGRLPEIHRPEWDMPEHPVGRGAPFSNDQAEALVTLTALYDASGRLLGRLAAEHAEASSVLCWPHHFDIATLLTVETDPSGAATKTVGVGMAPTGGGYDEWYWYVSPWPFPATQTLPAIEGPGEWHTEGWVGVVLSGQRLLSADPGARCAVVQAFVDQSVSAARKVLDEAPPSS